MNFFTTSKPSLLNNSTSFKEASAHKAPNKKTSSTVFTNRGFFGGTLTGITARYTTKRVQQQYHQPPTTIHKRVQQYYYQHPKQIYKAFKSESTKLETMSVLNFCFLLYRPQKLRKRKKPATKNMLWLARSLT